jgi:predicted enzyme related to lactoylglutathione lyase
MGDAVLASGLVVYALELPRVRAFYAQVFGAVPTHEEDTHAVLALGGFELIVHVIPAEHAEGITIAAPPEPREALALKPTFTLAGGLAALDALEGRVEAWGGRLLGPRWPLGAAVVRGVCDPEGNVLQVRAG